MKIAVVTGSVSRLAGGTFDAIRCPMNELIHLTGCRVAAFGVSDEHSDEDRASWDRVSVHALKQLGPRSIGFAPRLRSAIKQYAPDIVHLHGLWNYAAFAADRGSQSLGVPLIVSPHGMLDAWALRNSRLRKALASTFFQRHSIFRAARVHALCGSEADAIRNYGFTGRICQIPNGVDPPGECGRSATWQEMVPGEKNVLLYLGRLHPKKGLLDLLEAWRTVRACGLGANWVIVVAGWDQSGHRGQLERYCSDWELTSSVVFVGPQFGDDKAATLTRADAFILPSHSEGLPMTVLEAWSYELPVVMTTACNLSLAEKAGAAIICEPGAVSLTEALRTLFLTKAKQRAELGRQGQRLARREFSWRSIAEQWYRQYRECVEESADSVA